jgi:hypothetical protein
MFERTHVRNFLNNGGRGSNNMQESLTEMWHLQKGTWQINNSGSQSNNRGIQPSDIGHSKSNQCVEVLLKKQRIFNTREISNQIR